MIRTLIRTARDALRGQRPRALRLEPFGAIAQLVWPRALVFVDRAYARSIGAGDPDGPDGVWRDPDDDGRVGRRPLRAPLEAHLQLTNRCAAGCTGCYTGATPAGAPGEWGLAEWKRAVDELADMGVFHLALGGGESADLPWLGDIAEHARRRGLVPNLTTSGLSGLEDLLPVADLFGQINVSVDGLGATYRRVRGVDGFAAADRAVRALRARTRAVGINVVVTRHNVGQLGELFAYARARRLCEVELLRFKPSGRGAGNYRDHVCTDRQHRELLPAVLEASRQSRVRARLDCSYAPMIAHHDPGPEVLAQLGVYGCTGGDFLVGVKPGGAVTACSFAPPPTARPRADRLADYWRQPEAFGAFRSWREAGEPCRSCRYHELCRGGCKVVSRHAVGDARAPDPECPRVVDHRHGHRRGRPDAGGAEPELSRRRSRIHLRVL